MPARPRRAASALVPLLFAAVAAAAPGADAPDRRVLTIALPGVVDVGGLGRLATRTSSVFLVEGPLGDAVATRCSLDIESDRARGAPADGMPPAGPIAFVVDGERVHVGDAVALTPVGPVRYALRVNRLLSVSLDVEVSGHLSLEGRRDADVVRGAALWRAPLERVSGPSFLDVTVPPRTEARGTFTLAETSAATCVEVLAQRR